LLLASSFGIGKRFVFLAECVQDLQGAGVLWMREGSGACGSGGAHDGTGVCVRPNFLCYNFQKSACRILEHYVIDETQT
jgi:hypothetical protein